MAVATFNPVAGWDQRVLVATEASFAAVPVVSPTAGQSIEVYDLDMGPNEQQDTRPIKDKTPGRDQTLQFVSGRVKPMKWKAKTSMKTRAAVDTVPVESPLYKSAGLVETVNSGVSVAYSLSSAPAVNSICMYSALGAVPYRAEQGFGGIVEELDLSGGDHEVTLDLAGAFAGKFMLGQCSATAANGAVTSITVDNAGDEYKLSVGWYQWASEIIYISAVQYGSGTFTCARAQLASSGAAHAAVNLTPYLPAVSQPTTTPISEATTTITIDGAATRCTKWAAKIKTGLAHLPGESGSIRVQGAKVVRVEISLEADLVMTDDGQRLDGKVNQRKPVAVTIVQGSAAGGIMTLSLPYTIIKPFTVPAPSNDISMAKLAFMARGNAANDMFSLTLT